MFLTALVAALSPIVAVGVARIAVGLTDWRDPWSKSRARYRTEGWARFCVQRHTRSAIPLLRDEPRTVQVCPRIAADVLGSRAILEIPVDSWRADGVSLTDHGGYRSTFSERLLRPRSAPDVVELPRRRPIRSTTLASRRRKELIEDAFRHALRAERRHHGPRRT